MAICTALFWPSASLVKGICHSDQVPTPVIMQQLVPVINNVSSALINQIPQPPLCCNACLHSPHIFSAFLHLPVLELPFCWAWALLLAENMLPGIRGNVHTQDLLNVSKGSDKMWYITCIVPHAKFCLAIIVAVGVVSHRPTLFPVQLSSRNVLPSLTQYF